jgi:hypothetical protein
MRHVKKNVSKCRLSETPEYTFNYTGVTDNIQGE